jgi:hypothetical protein
MWSLLWHPAIPYHGPELQHLHLAEDLPDPWVDGQALLSRHQIRMLCLRIQRLFELGLCNKISTSSLSSHKHRQVHGRHPFVSTTAIMYARVTIVSSQLAMDKALRLTQ